MAFTTISLDEALARLDLITRAITALHSQDEPAVQAALDLVIKSATDLVPGADISISLTDDVPEPTSDKVKLFPLTVAGKTLGVLVASQAGSIPFQPIQLAWLEHLSGLAAIILSLADQLDLSQQEQTLRERQLRRVWRAGMLISSRSSLQDTLDAILRMALEITDASYGIFRLVDRSGKYLVTHSFIGQGLAHPVVENLPIADTSVMGYVANRREPVVISDLTEEPWRGIYYPLDYARVMRSEVAVPLIGASGRLEGVFNLESPEVNAFDKEDRYILQILATQAVVAIQEMRLLDALQGIAAMLYTHPLVRIHQALVEQACDLLNVPTSLIWQLDKGHLVVRAASSPVMLGQSIALGSGPTSRAIQSGQPVILLELKPNEAELPDLAEVGSGLIVPFSTGNESGQGGVFSVYTAPGDLRDFSQSDWDKRVLNILGHYAALAVQNAADLEALRLAEDQRATTETFAAIGDIAANLLHRLNNKVGTIPVRVEGIQDKRKDLLKADPYLATNLAEIQRSAAEAMQVVHENLDHLRPIQLAPVSVAACIKEALASTRLPSSVQVETQGLEGLPTVQAGADRLSLVFANLLENAADAMQGLGKVCITVAVKGRWMEIRVSDSGPGIPTELHERIFEFSYSSRAGHPGKLGFGLWWVKSLVTRFGGRVAVESPAQGGTTFILSLPLSEGQI
ncbi:MAG TPA: GAF domain-containing protein [Anaerolineaceae bacterium]|nr:GAF domain-containing protein [Anaerolineaceae bacterium]